jgi:hypothetical protein
MAVKKTWQTTIVSADRETVASGRRSDREAQPYIRYGEHRRPLLQRAAGLSTAHHKKKDRSLSCLWEVVGLEPLGY